VRIRFWGTRGSLPKPGRTTLRYGGNTSCVEVRTAAGTLIVLDCGTGAHELGQALLETERHPLRGHLLISHTHWDHIQGFPFFAPLFTRDTEWDIYAPGGLGKRLEEILAGQMEYTYFPVTLEQLDATVRYHDLVEGAFEIEDVHVAARFLNHPALTLGYRLEVGGARWQGRDQGGEREGSRVKLYYALDCHVLSLPSERFPASARTMRAFTPPSAILPIFRR